MRLSRRDLFHILMKAVLGVGVDCDACFSNCRGVRFWDSACPLWHLFWPQDNSKTAHDKCKTAHGQSWGHLGSSWVVLGRLGSSWGRLGGAIAEFLDQLTPKTLLLTTVSRFSHCFKQKPLKIIYPGAILDRPGAVLGCLGAVLGTSWAVLGHLEASWAVLGRLGDVLKALEGLGPFWDHFGVHFGTILGTKLKQFRSHCRDHFWDQFFITFRTTFGAVLGPVLGTKSAPEKPRWAQEANQDIQRPKNLHSQKP